LGRSAGRLGHNGGSAAERPEHIKPTPTEQKKEVIKDCCARSAPFGNIRDVNPL
jgi:hypothetical protein